MPPPGTVPPNPWKLTVVLFDDFYSAMRSEDLAAAREVLGKYQEAIDQGREAIDKGREAIDKGREDPWKFTIDLFDALDAAVRAENLAAAREALDKYQGTIDKGLFDAFDSAVRAEDLVAAREVLDKNREVIEKAREVAEREAPSTS